MADYAAPKANTDPSKALNYEKIIKLFTNRHTSELYDRQIAVIYRVCRHNPNGFKVADLPNLRKLVLIISQKVDDGMDNFAQPLCSVVDLCGKPFVRSKANEELIVTEFITDMLVVVGDLLHSSHPAVQLSAASALTEIAKGNDLMRPSVANSRSSVDDLRPTSRQFYQQLLNSSGVVGSAIDALAKEVDEMFSFDVDGDGIISEAEMFEFKKINDADMTNNMDKFVRTMQHQDDEENPQKPPPYFMVSLMKALREFSHHPPNAVTITKLDALQNMVKILGSVRDFKEELLLVTMEVLWNVLEHCDHSLKRKTGSFMQKQLTQSFIESNPIQILSRKATLQVLQDLLKRVLQGGYRKKDKELRNEVLIVSNLLATYPPSLAFFRTSNYLDLLLQYSIAPDLGIESMVDGDMHNFGTALEEDFELKQLMWGLVCKLAEGDQSNLEAVQSSQFIDTLLLYVTDPLVPTLRKWAPTQLKALQLQALSLLCTLVPLSPEKYESLGGNQITLTFLQVASSPNVLNQVVSDIELRHATLKLLLHTCHLLDFQDKLGELGAVEAMLDLFTDPNVPVAVRRDAIAVISRMTANGHQINQDVFRRAEGVSALKSCLTYRKEDALSNNFLIVAVVGAVWNAVVGNRRSEARLLQLEGTDALLDLLEVCPNVMRNQVLGVLADLCRNPKAAPFFRAWKSDISMKGAAQLLLSLWVEEETRLGVARNNDGLLNSLDRPLDGDVNQPALASDVDSPDSPSAPDAHPIARLKEALQAAKDMTESETQLKSAVSQQDMRAKIYAVLASVGFDLIVDELDIAEKMTFAVVERYPDFRQGQLWLDVKQELQEECVDPISADSLLMESKLEQVFNTAMATKCMQKSLLDSKGQDDKAAEDSFFGSILLQKEQELQAQLLMKKARMSKTSMKARLEAKQKKAEMLKKSLQKEQTMEAALAVSSTAVAGE